MQRELNCNSIDAHLSELSLLGADRRDELMKHLRATIDAIFASENCE
jgi:hypothetical protein